MTLSASLVTVSSEQTQSHRSPSVWPSAVNSRSQSGNVCSIRAKDGTVTKMVFVGSASAIPVKLLPVAHGMMILPRTLPGYARCHYNDDNYNPSVRASEYHQGSHRRH